MFSDLINIDGFNLLSDILLIAGITLFAIGFLFFFVPAWIIRWNSLGNTWLGKPQSDEDASVNRRLFWLNYAIFRNHRITGGVIWGLSSLFLWIYILYVS